MIAPTLLTDIQQQMQSLKYFRFSILCPVPLLPDHFDLTSLYRVVHVLLNAKGRTENAIISLIDAAAAECITALVYMN